MKVTGLNHITIAVSDLERSLAFYRDILGMQLRAVWDSGAYLEAGAVWICLSADPAARRMPHPDYTHIAFSVSDEDFTEFAGKIRDASSIWKDNSSEGDSIYFLDPDGHKLELHLGTLESRLQHYRENSFASLQIIEDAQES